MKTSRKFILAVCLSLVTAFTYANNKPLAVKSENAQIKNYLEKIDFNKVLQASTTLNIDFMINDANEIIVLGTNKENLNAIIKTGLNHKTIDVTNLKRNSLYIIPVLVTIKN